MRAIDGQIILFYSANAWATADYAIGYATCEAPTGPCTKVTTDVHRLGRSVARDTRGPANTGVPPMISESLWMPARPSSRSPLSLAPCRSGDLPCIASKCR